MNPEKFEKEIFQPLKRWAPVGEKSDEYGTRHIGYFRKDAPFGFLHQLHKPATAESIAKAEKVIGIALPQEYKAFLLCANGASFYNPSGFHVCGILQDSFFPDYECTPWRFPIDIIKKNEAEWLTTFLPGAVVIGRDDGASTDIVALADGRIREFNALEPEDDLCCEWASFDDWLMSEFNNLYLKHDDAGELLEISGTMH